MNKKTLIIVLVLVFATIILGLITQLLKKDNSYKLAVTTSPDQAQVFINNEYVGLTPLSTVLDKDNYIVRVEKQEFLSQEKQVYLSDHQEIHFNFSPNSQTAPIQTNNQNKLFVIDPKTSKLIEISPSKQTIIYDQAVEWFSYAHPLVAIIKKDVKDSFSYINLENGVIKDVLVKEINPIIGLSLPSDSQIIHFLGSFSPQQQSSTIYTSPLLQKKINPISSSSYTKIYPLTSPYLLALLESDGPDATRFIVINLDYANNDTYQNTSEINYNSQFLQFVSQTSTESTLFKYPYVKDTSVNIPTKPGFITVWLSDTLLLLVRPLRIGANYQYFDSSRSTITPEKKWNEIEMISIHKIPGISEGKIAIIDKQNNINYFNPPTQL